MLTLSEKRLTFNYSYCQQCGACQSVCHNGALSFSARINGTKNIVVNNDKCVLCKRCVSVCPANRLLTENEYIKSLQKKEYYLAYNTNKTVRRNSSSGGACKTLIIESLKSGFVDGVYSLRRLDTYPSAIGEFYTKENLPTFDDIPNSVYHSVMVCTEIRKVQKVHRLMIVGTSCQLYALEKSLKGKYDELIKVCIFCKQQKTLGSTNFLSKVIGTSTKENKFDSQYRGIGWPGIVRINDMSLSWEKAAGLPFGRRLWCVSGCDICGDPFGCEIGSDISLMDPWGIRTQNELGETLVIVHTSIGKEIMESTANLIAERKKYNEIKPALGEEDIWRKRTLIPFFKGEEVSDIVKKAGKAEIKQRKQLQWVLETLPRMPFMFYRLLNKIVPKKRDIILKERL